MNWFFENPDLQSFNQLKNKHFIMTPYQIPPKCRDCWTKTATLFLPFLLSFQVDGPLFRATVFVSAFFRRFVLAPIFDVRHPSEALVLFLVRFLEVADRDRVQDPLVDHRLPTVFGTERELLIVTGFAQFWDRRQSRELVVQSGVIIARVQTLKSISNRKKSQN